MTEEATGFSVSLDVFEGPFDLLLQLISKHQLDVTEVALARVTDEFVAYIAELDQDLEETTQFLLVASTLLDLKAARLLPQGDIEDEDDLALLEARDLLFARLLQYRAFKQIAAQLSERWSAQARRFVRTAGPDPKYRNLLPPVDIGIGPDEFALLAAQALTPRPEPVIEISHLHAAQVNVREQAHLLAERLRDATPVTFRRLCADAPDTITKVARFLAVLELFRHGAVGFDQAEPLADVYIRWTGGADDIDISDEFDRASGGAENDPMEAASDGAVDEPDEDTEQQSRPVAENSL